MIDPIQGPALRPAGAGLGGVAATSPAGSTSATRLPAAADMDFAGLIGDAVTDLANKLRNAEAVSVAAVKGTASMQDVVETVMAAEQTLQSAISIRDKVVSAYLEISRMSI